MNKIVIKNKGLILPDDLILIGSSTKRNDDSKIGMFGSGWKYALSWFLRNNISIEIYSGDNKIDISIKSKQHRDKVVDVITVNGSETSLTTEMGPDWTGWMALREVISNAIDEGEHSVDISWSPEITPSSDYTTIIIPVNNELSNIMMKYEHYFAFERVTNYVYDEGRVFLKSEKAEINIYRKGIRCYDDTFYYNGSYLDFDFNDIKINESRLSSHWDIQVSIKKILSNENLHSKILVAALKSDEFVGLLPSSPTPRMLKILEELYNSGNNFHCQALLNIRGMMALKENSLEVPDSWWTILEKNNLVDSLFSFLGNGFKFMKTEAFDTKGIEYYLKGINCNMKVVVGKFDNSFISVKVSNGEAYVSEKCEGNDRETAAKIIKEMNIRDIEALLE